MTMTMIVYPLVWYLLAGEIEPMLPILFPFIDETTVKGYCLCTVIHIFWVFMAALGFLLTDVSYAILTLYSWPLVDIMSDHLEGLNVALRTDRKLGETKEMKEYLRNIVRMHYDIML